VLRHRLTVGELLVVVAYIGSVYKPLEAISGTLGSLQDQLVNVDMAFELLDKQPDIVDSPGALAIPKCSGHVIFDGVGFSYAGRVETLKDISFEAVPGQALAIVGPTGAGKSTLVSLLPRFYDPGAGRIVLDGLDLRSLTLRSLREQVSIVQQDAVLFRASIGENIAYGRPGATEDEIVRAAALANADEFIERMPDGYHTILGERGETLSGGQRQRIAIARAIIRDAPILLLDEPSAALDPETEALVFEGLTRLMRGRTSITIAHRLATVRHADVIFVLNDGVIAERGTHDELLAGNTLYARFHRGHGPLASASAGAV